MTEEAIRRGTVLRSGSSTPSSKAEASAAEELDYCLDQEAE